MIRNCLVAAMLYAIAVSSSQAASLAVSIGIRETGGAGPNFADGGVQNGIEWVNRDGQLVPFDGNWHTVQFTPATDVLTAFAGTTANSVLEPAIEFAVLEHIRLLNVDGIAAPIRLWIDDLTVSSAAGVDVEGFEGQAVGTEVMFQEPSFSGSTTANVISNSTALVTDTMAYSGDLSLQADFEFVDSDPARWVRWSTFGASQPFPNPAIRVRDVSGAPVTFSFKIKAGVVPEPSTFVIAGIAIAGCAMLRCRRAR